MSHDPLLYVAPDVCVPRSAVRSREPWSSFDPWVGGSQEPGGPGSTDAPAVPRPAGRDRGTTGGDGAA